jgi:hypothetical protein
MKRRAMSKSKGIGIDANDSSMPAELKLPVY